MNIFSYITQESYNNNGISDTTNTPKSFKLDTKKYRLMRDAMYSLECIHQILSPRNGIYRVNLKSSRVLFAQGTARKTVNSHNLTSLFRASLIPHRKLPMNRPWQIFAEGLNRM